MQQNIFAQFQKTEQDYQIPPFVHCQKTSKQQHPKEILRNDIIIFVDFQHVNKLRQKIVICKESVTVAELKNKICKQFFQQQIHSPQIQIKNQKNEILSDKQTLLQAQIFNKSVIYCSIQSLSKYPQREQLISSRFQESQLQPRLPLISPLVPPLDSFTNVRNHQHYFQHQQNQNLREQQFNQVHAFLSNSLGRDRQQEQGIPDTEDQAFPPISLGRDTQQEQGIPDTEDQAFLSNSLEFITQGLKKSFQKQPINLMEKNLKQVKFEIKTVSKSCSICFFADSNIGLMKQVLANTFGKKRNDCLYLNNGKIITDEFNEKLIEILKSDKTIILIDSKDATGLSILLNQRIQNNQIADLRDLIDSLPIKIGVDQYVTAYIFEINISNKLPKMFKKYELKYLIAVALWTTKFIHKELNYDMAKNNYKIWYKYLKALFIGLNYCPIYKGKAYRGIQNYQNYSEYQEGSDITWSQVASFSMSRNVAKQFSNNSGTLFEVDLINSRDISPISKYQNEFEVLLMPFSNFQVESCQKKFCQPLQVKLKQNITARTLNILVWIDDKSEQHFRIIFKLQIQCPNLSIVICESTQEFKQFINQSRWIFLQDKYKLFIITDMSRAENGQVNDEAGADLLEYLQKETKLKERVLIYCYDTQTAKIICNKRNIKIEYQITNSVDKLLDTLRFIRQAI